MIIVISILYNKIIIIIMIIVISILYNNMISILYSTNGTGVFAHISLAAPKKSSSNFRGERAAAYPLPGPYAYV